ncbi:serine hydrolase [Candidatus Bipolaricaulota bacterium]
MIDKTLQKPIDNLFERFTRPGSPGCAIGVMQQGELAYSQGYGLANLEHNVTITPSTVFYIASMAKQFTGLSVAMLADQGKLDLDADIRTILPYVPDFGHPITTKHLLYHTSGLRSDIFLLMASGWRVEDVIRQEDIVELVKHQRELDFVPGTKFAYCGTGYILLAELVAALSGQSFPAFCRERIFEPLGMSNSHFEDDPIAVVPGRASAYFATGEDQYKNAVLTISLLGGTGLYSTIKDLAAWDENFYTGSVGGPSALELMQTPGTLSSGEPISYAFGLTVGEHHGRRVLSHAGDSAGVHCYMLRLPEEHLSVAILGNAGTVRASTLAYAVADLVLGIEQQQETSTGTSADAPEALHVDAALLEGKAGRYFDPVSSSFIEVQYAEKALSIYGYELSASSETEFFVTQHPEATAKFARDGKGTLTVTVDIGNGPTTYAKVDAVNPAPEALAAYTGTYRSPELDVAWRVALDGETLTVHRKRQGTSRLTPMCQDVFTDPWAGELLHGSAQWVIAFDREGERVTGLRVTAAGGRGRNLRFERIA